MYKTKYFLPIVRAPEKITSEYIIVMVVSHRDIKYLGASHCAWHPPIKHNLGP